MSIALPEMTPEVFLRQLPKVQDFSTDSDECPVCLEQYRRTRVTATGIIDRVLAMVVHRAREPEPEPIGTEDAVRLPCQHIFGSECIKRWISPAEGDQNTCPYVSGPFLSDYLFLNLFRLKKCLRNKVTGSSPHTPPGIAIPIVKIIC